VGKEGLKTMIAPFDPYPHELPSTYIVFDRPNKEEVTRLTIQDRSVTTLMGGVLPEQPDPTAFHDVLDIGSGTGGWVIQMAQTYPTMSLVGVDISKQMVTHANEQAEKQHVTDRVTFRIMDVLHRLDFPDASFDLTNIRFASSFVRTWEWRKVVPEMLRVTRPGGVIRITDTLDFGTCNSPALTQFGRWLERAMTEASYYDKDKKTTIPEYVMALLAQFRCTEMQTRTFDLEYQAGTPEWQDFYDYVRYSFRTLRTFLRHRGFAPKEYNDVCQQALKEMKLPDFHATWRLQTCWCKLPDRN
jgi:ubiquinone/menaquinone biosynthesis C-methylase UbiE